MDQWRDQLFIWIESVMMMTHIILIGIGFISSAHSDFKEVVNVAAPYFAFENFHYFQCAIFGFSRVVKFHYPLKLSYKK